MSIRRVPAMHAMRVVPLRLCGVLVLASLAAGCSSGSGYYGSGWDGRRGYDGNGDYGYDLAASRSEASSYRSRAAGHYPIPGTPDDPWGPYIREAAARFQIPEQWIRAVMHQESGGHEYAASGAPITSGAGAMGLMQVMPRTYDTLRRQYNLGPDPFDPHNNILAGAAYIRDMNAIYGAPGFLAAYNAGPDRLASYLAGNGSLPDETVNYLANVAPRLGNDVPMTGPLAVYAGTAATRATYAQRSDRMYASAAPIVMPVGDPTGYSPPADPSDRAFDGGGLVTPGNPTGAYTGSVSVASTITGAAAVAPVTSSPLNSPQPAIASAGFGRGGAGQLPPEPPASGSGITLVSLPLSTPTRSPPPGYLVAPAVMRSPVEPAVMRSPVAPAAMLSPVAPAAAATLPRGGGWAIQVGAFPDPSHSQAAIEQARARAGALLAGTQPSVIPVWHGSTLYRARLVGLSAASAAAVCGRLTGTGMACYPVPPGG